MLEVSPLGSVLTAVTASTTNCEKKSLSDPTILDDIAVLAQFIRVSLPRVSTLIDKFSSINLHACNAESIKNPLVCINPADECFELGSQYRLKS